MKNEYSFVTSLVKSPFKIVLQFSFIPFVIYSISHLFQISSISICSKVYVVDEPVSEMPVAIFEVFLIIPLDGIRYFHTT